nr:unnamed protein product [Spirometra erinaceieuropaei]
MHPVGLHWRREAEEYVCQDQPVFCEEEFDELCFPRRFPDSESPWFALLSLTEFCSSAESVKSLIKEVLKFQRLTLQGVLLYTESSKLTYTVASLFNRSALSDEPFEVFIVPKDLAPDLALQCAASNSTCFLSLGLPFAPDQMSELGMSNNLQSSRIFPPGVQKKAKQSDQHHVESSRFDEVSSGNTSIASRNNVRLFEILGLDKSALASGHDPASSSASNLSVLTSGSTHHPSQVLSSPSPRLSLVSPRVRYDNTSAVLHAKLDNAGPGSSSEDALLNRSSVLFVAVSFILLMIISLGWLIFYYIQRFRYLHSKERASRRLAELARKAVARIPVKLLRAGDKEIGSNGEHCAICIEPYRPFDNIRILPCRHYFHKVCIDPWLLEQRSCPMCKLDILQAYGLRPYLAFSVGEDSSLSHGGGGFHTDESGPTVEEATTTAALTTESPSVSYLSQPQQSSCAPDSATITDTCAGDSLRGKYAAVNDRKTRASATANSGGYQTCSEAGILGVESPTRALGSQSMDAEGTVVAANVAVTRSLSGQSSSPLLTSPAPLCATDYSPPFSTCLCAHTHSPTIGGSSPAEQCQRQHRLSFQQKMRAQSSDSSITQSNSSSQVVSQQQHKHLLPHLQPSDTQTLTSPSNPSKGDLAFVGSHLHHHRPNALTCTDAHTRTPPSHNSASGACGSSWDVGTSTSNHEENECHGDVNCDSSGSCRRQQKARKRGSEGPFVGWFSRGFYLNKPSVRHHDKGDRNVALPETFSSRFRHRRPPKDSSDAGGGGGADCPVSVKLMPHSPSASGLDPSVIESPDDEATLVGCRLLPQQPQQTYDESCSVAPSQLTPGACKEQLVVAVVEVPSSSAAHSSSGRDPATGDSALMT